MEKVKKYEGRKILTRVGNKNDLCYTENKLNIIRSFEDFKNDIENYYYTSIELLEDNLTLYRCQILKANNLSKLVYIRDNIANKCNYDTFLTKDEIIDLLENDYIVCLENNKEISLEEAKTL